MRAVRNTDTGIAVVEQEPPQGEGALMAVRSASICGSDFGYIASGSRFVLGHELAGTDSAGRPVAVEAIFGCHACPLCDAGRYNLCSTAHAAAAGLTRDGGMADQVLVPESSLVPLPEGLSVEDACLVEPGAVAWHALHLAGLVPGQRVAVVGAGGLGLLAAAAARYLGAADVAVLARHPFQRAAAEALGVKPEPRGVYDVVVEAAGSAAAVADAIGLVAPRGAVALLGVAVSVELPLVAALVKEAVLLPSIAYCAERDRRDVDEVAAWLAAEPSVPATVITHRFPLEDAAEAFRVAGDRSAALKVVVSP